MKNCIFCKIVGGEIPSVKIYEDELILAFLDIAPINYGHILVIPKGAYVSFDDFAAKASEAEIVALVRAVGKVAAMAGVTADGWRLLSNVGLNGHQEVPHLHVHVFGGRKLGAMIGKGG